MRDAEETCVADMVIMLRDGLGRPTRLWPVGEKLALGMGRLVGAGGTLERLFMPQRIDLERTKKCLQWSPPQSQREGIDETVSWYLTQR